MRSSLAQSVWPWVRSTVLITGLSANGHSAAQLAASSKVIRDSPVYSVCEVLRNPTFYEGKWIRVRGELTPSDYHPGQLIAGNCPGLDTRPFSPSIALSEPGQSFLRDRVDGLKLDAARLEDFERAEQKLRAELADGQVWATFCGVFQAKGARVFTFTKNPPVLYGYGHLGGARAQLIYEYAENASREPNPARR